MGLFDYFRKKKGQANPSSRAQSQAQPLIPSALPYDLENIISMSVGSGIFLRPYDYGNLIEDFDVDNRVLSIFIDDDVKKFLPGFGYLNTDARKYFESLVFKTEKGLSITYCVRINGVLSGMIFLDTPFFNNTTIGLNKWTISFFLIPPLKGKGIMTGILQRILFILRNKLGVNDIYALVDKNNTKSIHVLENTFFERTNISDDHNKSYTYRCNLERINFQPRP